MGDLFKNNKEVKGKAYTKKPKLNLNSLAWDLCKLIDQGNENGKFTSNMFLSQRISEKLDMPWFINQKIQKQIIEGFSKLIKIANFAKESPSTLFYDGIGGQSFVVLLDKKGLIDIKAYICEQIGSYSDEEDELLYYLYQLDNSLKDQGIIKLEGSIGNDQKIQDLVVTDSSQGYNKQVHFNQRDMSSGVRMENFQPNERLLATGSTSGIGTLYYGPDINKPLVRFGGRKGAYDKLYEWNKSNIEKFGKFVELVCNKIPDL